MRGAWIEIDYRSALAAVASGRAPCGARGLKLATAKRDCVKLVGRAPCGARGLKFMMRYAVGVIVMSRPMRGAWIEMLMSRRPGIGGFVAPHAGRVD